MDFHIDHRWLIRLHIDGLSALIHEHLGIEVVMEAFACYKA